MESAEAGFTRTLLSESKAAEVSKIIKAKLTLSDHKSAIKSSFIDQEGRELRKS